MGSFINAMYGHYEKFRYGEKHGFGEGYRRDIRALALAKRVVPEVIQKPAGVTADLFWQAISLFSSKYEPGKFRRMADRINVMEKTLQIIYDTIFREMPMSPPTRKEIEVIGDGIDINNRFALETVYKKHQARDISFRENIERFNIRDKKTGEIIGFINPQKPKDLESVVLFCRYEIEKDSLVELFNYISNNILENPICALGGSNKVEEKDLALGFRNEEIGTRYFIALFAYAVG